MKRGKEFLKLISEEYLNFQYFSSKSDKKYSWLLFFPLLECSVNVAFYFTYIYCLQAAVLGVAGGILKHFFNFEFWKKNYI